MSGIAYFDQRAKQIQRDDLIEASIASVGELKRHANGDPELIYLIETVERLKRMRRPEVVEALANAQRRRLAGA